MAEQRLSLWNAEDDLEEEVDLSIDIGSYGPIVYDDGEYLFRNIDVPLVYYAILLAHIHQSQTDLISMQQHMAQQAAFSQIPDVVKSVRYC